MSKDEYWTEWEGTGIDGSFVFLIPGWFEDTASERTLLGQAIKEIGITSRISAAQVLAEEAEWHLSWYGYAPGEVFPEVCDEDGHTEDGTEVDTVRKCTFAVVHARVLA